MYTIENTKKALINRFNENGWQELELTLKTGDRVWITPCGYGNVTNEKDVDWFLLDSDSVYLCGGENLDYIAKTLNNFSEIKAEDESSKVELEKFYEENIVGHSDEEWKLGNELYKLYYENPNYTWETPFSEIARDLAEQLNGDAEQFESALKLVENAGTYSDWYKDVWGHRPRY